MAGDWIKMRTDLGSDPSVIEIATSLGMSEDEVVGKLHRIWSWADHHTENGEAPAVTEQWLDRHLTTPGFASAMTETGWLEVIENGLRFPKFDRHMGNSAKRRLLQNERKAKSRDSHKRVTVPLPTRDYILGRDWCVCVYCGDRESLGIDHIVPVSRGGRSNEQNLVCSCNRCNGEKSDRTPEEWGTLPTHLQNGLSYSGHAKGVTPSSLLSSSSSSSSQEGDARGRTRQAFTKPTIEQIREYAKERGAKVDPEGFHAFYESNGWKVGKNPMKDWKAAFRGWQSRGSTGKPSRTNPTPEQIQAYMPPQMGDQ